MVFFADKQTTDDLNLLDRYRNKSVAGLFDETVSAGGMRLMEQLFRNPLTDPGAINERSGIFQYFTSLNLTFPFTAAALEVVENYLSGASQRNRLEAGMSMLYKKVMRAAINDKDFDQLQEELQITVQLLRTFRNFINTFPATTVNPYQKSLLRIKAIYADARLNWLDEAQIKISKHDYLLKTTLREEMKELLSAIFHLDVYIAVAGVARKQGFSFARALPADTHVLNVKGLYHPCIDNAVGNDLYLDKAHNVIFLTGANMAGKSTLMKSFGIGMYLAHMGFPVAAAEMAFSVKDGLFTSINVPDNIDKGYSHFYAEVLRVKTVAEAVAAGKNMVVIFDELFKGTNVKDAYDATLAIVEIFPEHDNCFFMISTHITEVGEALQQSGGHFNFVYLPTVMKDDVPTYTYQLTAGITLDKQGMIIIENAGILDILKS